MLIIYYGFFTVRALLQYVVTLLVNALDLRMLPTQNDVLLHLFSSALVTHTVPRTACLGTEVALFSLPFEARPVDPIRREVFWQQAAQGSTCWFSPSTIPPPQVPHVLTPARQISAGAIPPAKRRCRKGPKSR